jgi:hypothetical protein
MACRDAYGAHGSLERFWDQIHTKLTYLHGKQRLAVEGRSLTKPEDVLTFLMTCSDDHFLDFVEYVFQVDEAFRISGTELVEGINQFLRVDDLPYGLTDFVWEKTTHVQFGVPQEGMQLARYPKVICVDSLVTHTLAVAPTLALLQEKGFASANKEYLEALEDYRKADYGDCLTKCGSAFESTLKIICDRNGWPYSQKDTAGPLLGTVISQSGLEGFLEQPLLLVATLRNRLSKSHGSGTQVKAVSQAKAEYALNATAAAILLLVKEC